VTDPNPAAGDRQLRRQGSGFFLEPPQGVSSEPTSLNRAVMLLLMDYIQRASGALADAEKGDVGIRSAANMDQFARRTSCSEPQTLHRLRQARLTQQTRPQRQLAI
jgi:hypothetical protein